MALLRSEGLVGARSYAKPCRHDVQLKKPWRDESPYVCGAGGATVSDVNASAFVKK